MCKYLIENIRSSTTCGGMACGPVGGYPIVEVKFRDEEGNVHYRSLCEFEDMLMFYNEEDETFDARIAGTWEPEDPAPSACYDDYIELFTYLSEDDSHDALLDKLLVYMQFADQNEAAKMKQAALGKYTGEFDIPVCIAQSEYVTDHIMDLLDGDETGAIDALMEMFGDDLDEEDIFREAVQRGAEDYVRCHVYDIELNDRDGGAFSSYLEETDDPGMREILMDAGANPEYDAYEYRFFYDDENSEVLSFDEDLEKEAIKKILKVLGVNREGYIKRLCKEYGSEDNLPEPLDQFTFGDIEALITIAGDDAPEDFETNDCCYYNLCDLLEALGYDIEEEGQSGPHGHGSWCVRFIR